MTAGQGALRREIDFLLFDVLRVDALCALPCFRDHERPTFDAVLDAAAALAQAAFAPHARAADEHEPVVVDGRIAHVDGQQAALRAFADSGFLAATREAALGGAQLPQAVAQAAWGFFKTANIATETYAALSIGVANLVARHGTPAQRAQWLPPLQDGRCFGTMVLTEPQAGSSLADIRSTATPCGDGRYALRGQKTFITGGDQALSANIVHLVLARLPDAPAGTKGLSLFIVPKWRTHAAQGADRVANDVTLTGLIHKMGCRGTTSAMLAFGERGDCIGELLGPPNGGLACMFSMMNEARINVGMTAALLGLAGYHESLAYAKERRQGRIGHGTEPVALIAHADVQRMLLTQKAYAEGALALSLYGAWLADQSGAATDDGGRALARERLDLLTPVIKAWSSEFGLAANALAIQVLGGYGYTRDFPLERHYRDNRLNAIHEGTNGIQALDLLARKVTRDPSLAALQAEIDTTLGEARRAGGQAQRLADQLEAAWRDLLLTTAHLARAQAALPAQALAHASSYLEVFGHTVVGWLWLRQVVALPASTALRAADVQGKSAAAHWFFRWILGRLAPTHALLRDPDTGALALSADCF